MIWVHGGVHGDWGTGMFPFVREAVQRGYVIIAPDYRGSTGYGAAHFNAIDYGGMEVTDVMSAVEYLKTLPHVDQERLGIMGWSHGGFITAHSLFRDQHPFKGGAAIVPVTNLVFRLSYKGPNYTRGFSTQAGIRGMPFEKDEEYIKRSPLYHVEKLQVPILVHVATNDQDVNYVEDQQIIDVLRSASRIPPRPASTSIRRLGRERRAHLQPAHNTKTLEAATTRPSSAIRGTASGRSSNGIRGHQDRSAGGSRF